MLREPNYLLGYWQRYDWRKSFFAPHMEILQALTLVGKTASGIGTTRDAAFHRCLGETAEIHALAMLGKDGDGFQTRRLGIAAHLDPVEAQHLATLEAFERLVVLDWWNGRRAARPVCDDWLADHGVMGSLHAARLGADLRRRTDWWLVQTAPHRPSVMICRSTSPEGQDPLLGYGAGPDAVTAARKALSELLLMEMNLMELLASRGVGIRAAPQPVLAQMSLFKRELVQLLVAAPSVAPPADLQAGPERGWFDTALQLRDITPPDGPIHVWIADPGLPSSDLDKGSPFI